MAGTDFPCPQCVCLYHRGLGTPTNTVTYTYGDAQWGDLLTAYNGSAVTYDNIGNPLSDGTWTYTWQHGRQLASMTNGDTTWSYSYNADGLRTKRTDGTTTYTYAYCDGELQYMEKNGTPYMFTFAPDGTPMGMVENDTVYYYVTNLQGDVVGIVNKDGDLVTSYTYDSWGNVLSITGSKASTIGQVNPIRYRGYVYDFETGLYYLQSRYYNPQIGRFLNADGQLTNGSLTGINLFTYCGNNPVNRGDFTGEDWTHWIIGAAIVVGLGLLTVATCGGSLAFAATSVCLVANGVAAATTATTVAAAAFIGSATVYGGAALNAAFNSKDPQEFADQGNWGTVAATAFGGLTGGYDGYTMSKAQAQTPTTTGKGTQNPKVKAAVQKGQSMHKQMDYGPGVVKEKTIAPGCRVDGIDFVNRIIYELKPNNPQAIARGMSQLNRYTAAASQQYGGEWTGVLKLYD